MGKTISTTGKNVHIFTTVTERIEDMTWPIGVQIRDFFSRWCEGSGMIELDVYFVLQPEYVPIEVQSIGLHYSGDWFYGIDTVVSDEIPVLVGQKLDKKGMIGPYMVHFKIPEPCDRDTVVMNPVLVIDALDLPCIVELSTVVLSKQ